MRHKPFKHVASIGFIAAIMAVIAFFGCMPRAQAQDHTIGDGITETVTSGAPFSVSGDLMVNGSGKLNIISGGIVNSEAGRIGDAPHASATASSVTVDGASSVWTMYNTNSPPNPYPDYELSVGYSDDGELTISGGGTVNNYNGRIGFSSGVSGTVKVTGQDSTWNNERNIYVGFRGNGELLIEDNGTANSAAGIIGYQNGSVGVVTVRDAGSTWVMIGGLAVGDQDGSTGTLNIENGGAVSNLSGSIGINDGSLGLVNVDGNGSTWTNSGILYVGRGGTGELAIRHSGEVTNTDGYIGVNSGSSGKVTVADLGSNWTNSNALYVGFDGTGEMAISNEAKVTNTDGYIGSGSGSSGEVTVTGAGSLWANAGDLYVARYGDGKMTISNSGEVTNVFGYIGVDPSGNIGEVTVTGVGSLWENTSDLYVGVNGIGTLDISNGGKVTDFHGYIGGNPGSSGVATVDGPGSYWENNGDIHVGTSGNGKLDVTNGGLITNINGYIATYSGSVGEATVDNATWTNSDHLYVAFNGTGKLNINNAGLVENQDGYIGADVGGIGEVTVDNSTWTNTGNLHVGREGNGKLSINNAGLVTSQHGYIGTFATGVGAATVDNSTWTNAGNLEVGVAGSGKLDILNGSSVTSTDGSIGVASGGIGEVAVDNSTWTNTGNLEVGVAGSGKLDIINGSSVANLDGSIGTFAGGVGEVTVDNSTWTNNGVLQVGFDGDGKLGIINGGLVTATGGVLIAHDSASNSSLEVATGGTLETLALAAGNGTPSVTFDDGTLRAIADNTGFISDFSIGELIIDAGGLTIDSDVFDIATDSSAFTGSGGLTKIGAGTLTLGGSNAYSGDTLVAFGTLKASDIDVFSPNSAFTINTGATLDLDGYDQSVAGLINSGVIRAGSTTSVNSVGTTLTVNGNYESNGGSLYLRTTLGDDSSPTDKVIADSVTTGAGGATSMYITNVNGAGSYTYADGIQVVEVRTTSSNDAFKLGAPVTAGIYEYTLAQSSNQSWYLTNTEVIVGPFEPIDPPTDPSTGVTKLLNPNIGSYLGNQHAAATMFRHSIFDRLENLSSPDQTIWLRVNHSDLKTDLLDGRQHADITTTIAQIGIDLIRRDQWVAGVYGGYGHSKTENKSNQTGTKADGKVDGGHVGLYWSWLPKENYGFYTDLWTYYAWFNNKLTGEAQNHTTKYDSTGYAFSGEVGYQIPISRREDGGAWLLTPQAQLSYVNVDADDFTDSHGTRFSNNEGSGVQSRLGARLHGQRGPCFDGVLPFIELNWLHNAADNDIRLDGTSIGSVIGRNVGEVKVGLQGTIIEGLSVWGHVGARQGSEGYERYDVQLGLAKRW